MNFQDVFNVFMGLGGLGGLALVIKTLSDRRKTGADADVTIADGALRQMERMDIEITRLDNKLAVAATHGDRLAEQVDLLSSRIREMHDELAEYHRRYGPLRTT